MDREPVYEGTFILLLMVMLALADLDDFLNSLLPVTAAVTLKVVPFNWIKICYFQIALAEVLIA